MGRDSADRRPVLEEVGARGGGLTRPAISLYENGREQLRKGSRMEPPSPQDSALTPGRQGCLPVKAAEEAPVCAAV